MAGHDWMKVTDWRQKCIRKGTAKMEEEIKQKI
jgi:hypothetical protein